MTRKAYTINPKTTAKITKQRLTALSQQELKQSYPKNRQKKGTKNKWHTQKTKSKATNSNSR